MATSKRVCGDGFEDVWRNCCDGQYARTLYINSSVFEINLRSIQIAEE